jgi:hypothetical protein
MSGKQVNRALSTAEQTERQMMKPSELPARLRGRELFVCPHSTAGRN